MIESRQNALIGYLTRFFGNADFALTSVADDASFRRYFRVKLGNSSFIMMDSPPENENCNAFIQINKILIDNGIYAPKIIHSDSKQGFLLLEDLGDETLLKSQQKTFNLSLYQTAIDSLIKLQSIKQKTLPNYDKPLLHKEMQLLTDWYLRKNLSPADKQNLQTIFTLLSTNALKSPQVLVHRDYHSRNLMVVQKRQLGIIDFQDAVIGADTYDLVSLLKDAYFEMAKPLQQTLLKYYYQQANISRNFTQFEKQFDLMGLQRHLKILGIFTRLSVRDGKHQYLANIPQVLKYALETIAKYPKFSPLKPLLINP